MDATAVLVAALATARITRLVTHDRITEAPRRAVLRRLRDGSLLAYLVVCDWCASVYVGAAVAAAGAAYGAWTWVWAPALALAFSYTAGWLAAHETEGD